MDRGVLSGKRGVLITLLLFLSVLLFPMMKVHAADEFSFTLNVYSSKDDFDNGQDPYVVLTESDGEFQSWGEYELSTPEITVPEGSKITNWVETSNNWDFGYNSYDLKFTIQSTGTYNVYPKIVEDNITINVYSSKESMDNGESPCVVLRKEDASSISKYNWSFNEPSITVPDGYEINGWKRANTILNGGEWRWWLSPTDDDIGGTIFVYPLLKKFKNEYTVEFYAEDPRRNSSATLLKSVQVNRGETLPADTLPDLTIQEDKLVETWYYLIKDSDGNYSNAYSADGDWYPINDISIITVNDDIALYPTFMSRDAKIGSTIRRYSTNQGGKYTEIEDPKYKFTFDDAVNFDGMYYIPLKDNFEIPEIAGYTFSQFNTHTDAGLECIYKKDGDTFTKLGCNDYVTSIDDLYMLCYTKFGNLNGGNQYTTLYYVKNDCTLTIKDAYYDTDSTTLIETTERTPETVTGGQSYKIVPLDSEGFTYSGYRVGDSSYVFKGSSYTPIGDKTLTCVYVKKEDKPSGRIEIPVEIEADGETKTDFVVDRTILGGDLIVSIPAEMILEYDSGSETLAKEDYVSATGRCISTSKLEVKTLTSITYANEADNSIKVPGTIAFGTTSDTYQVTEWSAAELLAGVKNTADIAKKDIKASVLKSDIDFVGSYATSILYNISVLETT